VSAVLSRPVPTGQSGRALCVEESRTASTQSEHVAQVWIDDRVSLRSSVLTRVRASSIDRSSPFRPAPTCTANRKFALAAALRPDFPRQQHGHCSKNRATARNVLAALPSGESSEVHDTTRC